MAKRYDPPDDRRCTANRNADGTRCGNWATGDTDLCTMHNGTRTKPLPPDDRRCTGICSGGTTRPERKGERCDNWASPGLNVCCSHGASKRARAAGRRRVVDDAAEKKVRKLMVTYGKKIDTTAVDALIGDVQWTAGHVAWLRERIGELEQGELIWGTTRVKDGGEDRGTTEEAIPHVLLKIYQAERTHLVQACSVAIRAGIEERRVKLAEAQGVLVAQVIKRILDDLGLTGEQLAKVSEIVPRHLRMLAS